MSPPKDIAVILAAAGKSSRFQGENGEAVPKKTFAGLLGKPVWLHSAERFSRRDDVEQLIVVVSPEDITWFRQYYAEEINRMYLLVVPGGEQRVDSVRNALQAVRKDIELVAVHDAARPCFRDELIDAVFEKARSEGAAMLASPIVGTVKRVRENRIVETVPREELWEAQTPQVFRREIIKTAFNRRGDSNPTDDAALVEQIGFSVFVVSSDRWNIKITTQTDLTLAELILSAQNGNNAEDLRENMAYDNLEGS